MHHTETATASKNASPQKSKLIKKADEEVIVDEISRTSLTALLKHKLADDPLNEIYIRYSSNKY